MSELPLFTRTVDDEVERLKKRIAELEQSSNKIKADAIREAVDNLTFDGLGAIKKLLDYADKLEQSE